MATATKTKETPALERIDRRAPDGKDWNKAGLGDLPPFLILREDDIAQGIIREVRVKIVDILDKKKKKIGTKEEFYYHMELSQECSGLAKKDTPVTYKAGTLVTIPGGGNLDYTMGNLAFKFDGVEEGTDTADMETPWPRLVGREYFIHRVEGSVMKKGQWKGTISKNYIVNFRDVA